MRLLFTIAALAAATPAAAVQDNSVAVPIAGFLDAFNKGDMKAAAATFAKTENTIIDEFAPHFWFGPNALATWAADYAKDAAARGIADGKVTLGAPTRTEVEATTAYVITPARYTFKQHGTAMVEDGTITFALTGKAKAWKIAGWAWSGPAPKPAK